MVLNRMGRANANEKMKAFPNVAATRSRLCAPGLSPAMETVVMGQMAHESNPTCYKSWHQTHF
jgi:hypothetical protein